MTHSSKLVEAWSFTTLARLAGLSVPPEGPLCYAWDHARRLYRVSKTGRLIGQELLPWQPVAAAGSQDGRTFAFLSENGTLHLRDSLEGTIRTFELHCVPTALAIDAFGQHVVVADADRRNRLLDRLGKPLGQTRTPRALGHIAFGRKRQTWFGAALSYVAAFDTEGRELWSDRPLYACGGLAIDGADRLTLACHGGGLLHYPPPASTLKLPNLPPPSLAAAALAAPRLGMIGAAPGADGATLALLKTNGAVIATCALPGCGLQLALSPRGDEAIVGLAEGRLLGLRLVSCP